MKKEDIHFADWHRWLFGETPPQFMAEVIIRTVLVYILLLLVVRQMGKRMAGQATLTEMAVMVTLGAIVSPVMQLPDRGILFAIIALGCTYIFQRGLNWLAVRSERVERLTQGRVSLLVRDGTLLVKELERAGISRQQLFSILRENKITNLGRVERMYLEACGLFSIYETKESKPGLAVVPPSDQALLVMQVDSGYMACCVCGHVQKVTFKKTHCDICHSCDWAHAYLEAKTN